VRVITKFVTVDGVEHDSEKKARSYCDDKMGEILCKLAGRMTHLNKYSEFMTFLEENLETLVEARRWKDESLSSVNDDAYAGGDE
jgi:hypothetical protein